MARKTIVQLFQSVDSRAWDALPRFFTEDVVYERPGYEPLRGLRQLSEFYRLIRVIESGEHHLEQIVVSGAHAACWGQFRGLHRNGDPISERFADWYEFSTGKIRWRHTYFFRPAV